jgi:predicted nucleic acid-binding protein
VKEKRLVLYASATVLAELFDVCSRPHLVEKFRLAVAAQAKLIVSRDKDLLALRDSTSADGKRLQVLAPGMEILTPVELIRQL